MKDRKQRVRYKNKKVSNRNRLSVFRSNNHIYAQLIDDDKGITLASSSSLEKSIKDMNLSRKEIAEIIFMLCVSGSFVTGEIINVDGGHGYIY